jgi:hypothetical protein
VEFFHVLYFSVLDIFTGDLKSVERMKTNWTGIGSYAPSTTYHHECPEHNQKNKLGE